MITFYKDNLISQKFEMSADELKAKFKQWRNDNPSKRDSWPRGRQIDVFLMEDVGAYESSEIPAIKEAFNL